MTRDELISRLRAIAARSDDDPEAAHAEADGALLEFVADPEIAREWQSVSKWYA